MASKALLKGLFAASKATVKAAGQGAQKGIKNAVAKETKPLAQNILRQARSRLAAVSLAEPDSSSLYQASAMPLASLMVAPATFPAYCACTENPRAQRAHDGKRMYLCHKCGPRGMGVGDFRTQYETNVEPLSERVKRIPKHLANFTLEKGSQNSKAASRGRNKSRRASGGVSRRSSSNTSKSGRSKSK